MARSLTPLLRKALFASVLLSLISTGVAQDVPAEPPRGLSPLLRLRGIFDPSLPDTHPRNALRLSFDPSFGDLVRRDTLRLPFELRYGLTDNWEVSAEAETYFAHGFGSGDFMDEGGLANVRLNTKYGWRAFHGEGWDAAVGVEYLRPIGEPPRELTDGLEHIRPFVTFAYRLKTIPDVRVFWGLSADFVSHTSMPYVRRVNEMGDDSQRITGGFVWERGLIAYTFEAWYETTRLSGPIERDLVAIRPGVVWVVPQRYTSWVGGQWQLGIGGRIIFGPDKTKLGVSAKARVDYDFRGWFHRVRRSWR